MTKNDQKTFEIEPMKMEHVMDLVKIEKRVNSYYDEDLDMDITRDSAWNRDKFIENSTKNKQESRPYTYTENGIVKGCVVYHLHEKGFYIQKILADINGDSKEEKEKSKVIITRLISKVMERALENNFIKKINITIGDYNYLLLEVLRKMEFKIKLIPNKKSPYADMWDCSIRVKRNNTNDEEYNQSGQDF